eukprot:235178-Chlamydomonas_euryale.AAC.6
MILFAAKQSNLQRPTPDNLHSRSTTHFAVWHVLEACSDCRRAVALLARTITARLKWMSFATGRLLRSTSIMTWEGRNDKCTTCAHKHKHTHTHTQMRACDLVQCLLHMPGARPCGKQAHAPLQQSNASSTDTHTDCLSLALHPHPFTHV